jgi:ribosomal protein S18 acetylase RimI-like enzyme
MNNNYTLRVMQIEDYEKVYSLWMTIDGFGIRSLDDSYEGVARFLRRNPTTSVVAVNETGDVIGAILCGHDGRRGCFYHVCVHKNYRKHGIGKAMAVFCMQALKAEDINKVSLIAFKSNVVGNTFWKKVGWTFRDDLNYYDFTLNEENITKFNRL